MRWAQLHSESEKIASEAELAFRARRYSEASQLYKAAADLEKRSLDLLVLSKTRTRGIIAISAVALYAKSGEYSIAEQIAHAMLGEANLPEFARKEVLKFLGVI